MIEVLQFNLTVTTSKFGGDESSLVGMELWIANNTPPPRVGLSVRKIE